MKIYRLQTWDQLIMCLFLNHFASKPTSRGVSVDHLLSFCKCYKIVNHHDYHQLSPLHATGHKKPLTNRSADPSILRFLSHCARQLVSTSAVPLLGRVIQRWVSKNYNSNCFCKETIVVLILVVIID